MTSRRTTDQAARRVLAAVAVPTVISTVACTLALARPAAAAGGTTVLPFPTAVCSTTAKATGTTARAKTPKPSTAGTTSKAASPSASASVSPGAAVNGVAATAAAPSGSPSASASPGSTGGGFWGWLNGVWTWIFGAVQMPHAAAAPMAGGGLVRAAATAKPRTSKATPSVTASCLPSSKVKKAAVAAPAFVAANVPWHLSTPSMTMYNLTYNGVSSVQTRNGPLQVLDFTASKVTILSMVTYSDQGGGMYQFNNGGSGQTVTLDNVHLWTTSMSGDLLGVLPVTFTPSSPPPLIVGVANPIPTLFTSVQADNAMLNTGSIDVPGFQGYGAASTG